MPLNRADVTTTEKFEDGDAWLVLRLELTKGDADRIADLQQNYRMADSIDGGTQVEIIGRIAALNAAYFQILADSWSLSAVPTVEEYHALDRDSGDWVDKCVLDVLKKRTARAEGKSSSSDKPSARRRSGPKAQSSD